MIKKLITLFLISLFKQATYSSSQPLDISQINFEVTGDPKNEAIILIHGLSSSSGTFKDIKNILAQKNYFVVTYDQRGHGKSADIGYDYSTDLLAQDLLVLVKHLHLNQFYLLGHSMGARTAMKFASKYPTRVRALIIEDMELIKRSDVDFNQVIATAKDMAQIPCQFSTQIELINALSPFLGLDYARKYRNLPHYSKGQLVKAELLQKPYVEYLYGHYANSEDLSEAPKNFSGPILVLQATAGGGAISKKGAKQLLTNNNVQLIPIANSYHNIHQSQQSLFLDEVIKFLNHNVLN